MKRWALHSARWLGAEVELVARGPLSRAPGGALRTSRAGVEGGDDWAPGRLF